MSFSAREIVRPISNYDRENTKKKKISLRTKGEREKKNPRISEFNNVKRFFIENVSKRPSSVFLTAIFNVAFKNDFSFTPRRSFFFFFIPAAPVLFFLIFFAFTLLFELPLTLPFSPWQNALVFLFSSPVTFFIFLIYYFLWWEPAFFFFCIQIKDLCLL